VDERNANQKPTPTKMILTDALAGITWIEITSSLFGKIK
jgi:hypothetical protein